MQFELETVRWHSHRAIPAAPMQLLRRQLGTGSAVFYGVRATAVFNFSGLFGFWSRPGAVRTPGDLQDNVALVHDFVEQLRLQG